MEKKNRNIIIINIFSKNQPKFCLFCRPRGPISKLCLRRSSCSSWLDFKFIPLLKSYIVLQNPEKSYDFKLGQNLASLFCIHTYAFNYYIAVSRYVFTIPQGTISNSITYFFSPSSSLTTYPLELYFFRQMRDILLRDIVSYHLCPFLSMEKLIFKKSRA